MQLNIQADLRGDLHILAAHIAEQGGDLTTACEIWDKVLSFLEGQKELVKYQECILLATITHRKAGNRHHTIDLLKKALEVLDPGDIDNQVYCLVTIGNILSELNIHSEAVSPYSKAVELLRRENKPDKLATALSNLGTAISLSGGSIEEAEKLLMEAIEIRRNHNWIEAAGDSFLNLDAIYSKRNLHGKALYAINEARSFYQNANLPKKEAHCLYRMAFLNFEKNNYQQAKELSGECESLLRCGEPNRDTLNCLLLKATIDFKETKYIECINNSIEAVRLAENFCDWLLVLGALSRVGASLVALGQIVLAQEVYTALLDASPQEKNNDVYGRVISLIGLGVCAILQRRFSKANKFLKDASIAAEKLHNKGFLPTLTTTGVIHDKRWNYAASFSSIFPFQKSSHQSLARNIRKATIGLMESGCQQAPGSFNRF